MLCDWEGDVSTCAWLAINSACQVIKYLPLSPGRGAGVQGCRGAGVRGAGAQPGPAGQAASSLKGQYRTTSIYISACRLG